MEECQMNISKTCMTVPVAAFGLAMAFAVAAPDSAQAYQCKSTVVHAEAHANTRIQARSGARSIWTNTAKSQFGLPWSVWNIADDKSMTCNWTGNQHWCIAEAKPCLYVVQ